MDLFTYLMAKNDHNTSVNKDLFSYLLGKGQSGTYQDYSGTSLSINNTKKGKMKLYLSGNTGQDSTTGKNLLGLTDGTYSDGGITAIVNNDEIKITGTGIVGNTAIDIPLINTISSSLGTLTKSLNPSGTYTNIQTSLRASDKSSVGLWSNNGANNTGTLTGDAYYLRIQINEGISANCTFKAQVETGSTATSWEIFSYGASPNPSYPQTIHNVSGNNSINVSNSDSSQSASYPVNLPVENILNNTATTITYNQVTFTINEDKSVTINGTPTADTNIVLDTISFVSGETYTISGVTGYSDTTLQIYTSSSTAFPSDNRLQCFNGAVTRIAQASETCLIKLYVYSGVTYNNVNVYPQIEKGTKANHYTPYGTTPIEMCKIGTYQDKFIRNSGKNLLSSPFTQYDGNNLRTGQLTLEAGTYTFSFEIASTTGNQVSFYRIDGGTTTLEKYKYTTKSLTATLVGGTYFIDIYQSGILLSNMSLPMLNEGSTPLPYEPYGNGDWYLKKDFSEDTLTGSNDEGWIMSYDKTNSMYIQRGSKIYVPLVSSSTIPDAKSNIFSPNTADTLYSTNTQGFTFTTTGYLRVNVLKSVVSTISDWETYLGTHNMKLIYPLATPTYTKITDTNLINQLEAVYRANSYKDQTNISQTNNDLPFNLDVEVKVSA